MGKQRTKKDIEFDILTQTKVCGACKERNPFTDYYNSKTSVDGFTPRCKRCDTEARKKWQANNREKSQLSQRKRNIKHKYGLDYDSYLQLLGSQNHKCAICEAEENTSAYGKHNSPHFSVDHNHDTGKVRGLLCNQCNRALGMFKDSPEILEKALKYLQAETH